MEDLKKLLKEHYAALSLYLFIFFWTSMISPISCVVWLLASTIYYFYISEPKKAARLWGFYFFIWYSLFAYFLLDFDNYIVFGGQERTDTLMQYIIDKPNHFFFKQFCYDTIIIFNSMCEFFGVAVYLPPLFKGLFLIFTSTIIYDLLGDLKQILPQITKKFKK